MATTKSTTVYFREDYTQHTPWSTDRWPVFYRAGKDIKPGDPHFDWYPHHRIVVTAGLHGIGNQTPYWSVTGNIVNRRKRGDNAIECCGSIHEEILAHFPELEPIVRLHLADQDGVPMHAAANGAYWLGFTEYKTAEVRKTPDGGLETVDLPWFPYVANLWRISEQDARRLIHGSIAESVKVLRNKEDVEEYVRSQRPRWAGESLEAIRLLRRLGIGEDAPEPPE